LYLAFLRGGGDGVGVAAIQIAMAELPISDAKLLVTDGPDFQPVLLPNHKLPAMANPLVIPVLGWLRRLSYPRLFVLTAVLFVVNLLIPDPLPLVDELLLGLVTLLLAGRKRSQPASGPPPIPVRPLPR